MLTKLNPAAVALHFLASIAVLAAAVALHVRCTEGTGPARSLVRADLRLLSYALVAVVAVMLAAGTVVTGTGPLAGAGAVPRFHLPLTGVTQFHADIGWLLGGLAIPLAIGLRLTGAPAPAVRLGWVLLALIGLQGVVGYTQYFTGLPPGPGLVPRRRLHADLDRGAAAACSPCGTGARSPRRPVSRRPGRRAGPQDPTRRARRRGLARGQPPRCLPGRP